MQLNFNLDNEWKFITLEITENGFGEVGHEKRLFLFFMQILLKRICFSENKIEKEILLGKYFDLKQNFF